MMVSVFIVFLVLSVSTILYGKYTKRFHYGATFFKISAISSTFFYLKFVPLSPLRLKLMSAPIT